MLYPVTVQEKPAAVAHEQPINTKFSFFFLVRSSIVFRDVGLNHLQVFESVFLWVFFIFVLQPFLNEQPQQKVCCTGLRASDGNVSI